jgi:hypothetical protein
MTKLIKRLFARNSHKLTLDQQINLLDHYQQKALSQLSNNK